MRGDRTKAFDLRRKGKSYREIVALLGVPRSTLSGWFGKEDWSIKIREKLTVASQETHMLRLRELNKVRGKYLELAYDEARTMATQEFEVLKYNPLFIAGMMLYWGEGDKATKHQVRLTNTDAEMLNLYYVFLKDVCGITIDKIGAHVLIYPDLDAQEAIKYWASCIGIPEIQFLKCTTIQGKHPTRRLEHGVCSVYVSSTYFKAKMLEWLKLIPKELISRQYYEKITPEAAIV